MIRAIYSQNVEIETGEKEENKRKLWLFFFPAAVVFMEVLLLKQVAKQPYSSVSISSGER